MSSLFDVVKGVATVALIALATRWVTGAKGSDKPRVNEGVSVYGIRWPVRAIAYSAAALLLILAVADLRTNSAGRRWTLIPLFLILTLGAFWFGSGVVISDETSISKRFLWHGSSLRWKEISEIRFHKRDGGAIELRGNGKNLIVDSRFVAQAHLRHEIEQRTKLQSLTD